jgi:hypothetical protein
MGMMVFGNYLLKLAVPQPDWRSSIGIKCFENLYKVGGSLKRLKLAENLLWIGEIDATMPAAGYAYALFVDLAKKQTKNFCAYLNKHRSRIINYGYYQAEQICSIGSGSVESAIKQIGLRLKLSGAQWNPTNVPSILQLRCAYLNGQLAI